MGDIDRDPASVVAVLDPRVDPRMSGAMSKVALTRMNVTRDIPCWHANGMAAGDEEVGMVLANALAQLECIVGRAAGGRGTGLIADCAADGFGQR